MRTTIIPDTDVRTTVLGLGCADMFRLPTAHQRLHVLTAAYDGGIRHFDTAPMYGLGLAERELGRFIRGRRDQVVIATKFGIKLTATGRTMGKIQRPVRRLLAAAPSLQVRARQSASGPTSGTAGSLLYAAPNLDAAAAERSLTASLRALRTDYVDLFLLHDPAPLAVNFDEIRSFCEHAVADGRIRAWGVAGEPEPSRQVARSLASRGLVLQLRADLEHRSRQPLDGIPAIAFGVLGRDLRAIARHLAGSVDVQQRWSAAVGDDCADPRVLATLLLRAALRANPRGVVLIGSTDPRHVADVVVAATPDPVEPDLVLDAFQARLRELPHLADVIGA